MRNYRRNDTLLKSFACAVKGILWVTASQRNMKIHQAAAAAVLAAAVWFEINYLEAAIVFFAMALVMVAEMVNTAVEKTVDLVTQEYHPLAGRAKDAAAGAVLLAAFFSVCIGIFVFLPYIKKWLAKIF
ncbi:MAG: diacylglycerol kinase family protein [Bacillota bacterium]